MGLPLRHVRTVLRDCLEAAVCLAKAGVVHSDIKPDNIAFRACVIPSLPLGGVHSLLTPYAPVPRSTSDPSAPGVALVDFGSSSFVGCPTQHYVQSRYYRAPEVLLGLPFGPAIDVWSLGCLAAELHLGIPALPGASEYDQLRRITRAVG